MTFDLSGYISIVFDCDGVILDSNKVKTEAFRSAAMPYGEAAAEALVQHHVANGGVSRYKKFSYFLEHIVPEHSPELINDSGEAAMRKLLSDYAQSVYTGLMNCTVANGLSELRAATPSACWTIVSGGDQQELRNIFSARGLSSYFDGGIMGSPDTKDDILNREKCLGNINSPALFLGDSRYDHQAATRAGLDFVFVSGWTEMPGWAKFTKENNLYSIKSISDLTAC
jgi:phosphoglycolate phosphatase-like HAD superfamily hydrolase